MKRQPSTLLPSQHQDRPRPSSAAPRTRSLPARAAAAPEISSILVRSAIRSSPATQNNLARHLSLSWSEPSSWITVRRLYRRPPSRESRLTAAAIAAREIVDRGQSGPVGISRLLSSSRRFVPARWQRNLSWSASGCEGARSSMMASTSTTVLAHARPRTTLIVTRAAAPDALADLVRTPLRQAPRRSQKLLAGRAPAVPRCIEGCAPSVTLEVVARARSSGCCQSRPAHAGAALLSKRPASRPGAAHLVPGVRNLHLP